MLPQVMKIKLNYKNSIKDFEKIQLLVKKIKYF